MKNNTPKTPIITSTTSVTVPRIGLGMKNNIGELRDTTIDLDVLRAEWALQVTFASDHTWISRNYVDLNFFTAYYQQLLLHITDLVGVEPKNYLIQVFDPELCNDKWYLNRMHKDIDRKTCITLPIYYNRMEPINFYDTVYYGEDQYAEIVPGKLNQTAHYSEYYPTIINVNNYHNVRVIDELQPRIFIQMSYDIHFDEFFQKDINIHIL